MKKSKVETIFQEIERSGKAGELKLFRISFELLIKFIEELTGADISLNEILLYLKSHKFQNESLVLEEIKDKVQSLKKEIKDKVQSLEKEIYWLKKINKTLREENEHLKECERRLQKITSSNIYKIYSKLKIKKK